MKTLPPISMRNWLAAQERYRVLPTDYWYLTFANKLLPIVKQSPLFVGKYEVESAAISLTLYLYDVIAQSGGWKTFSDQYHAMYGTYLPFYQVTDEYIPDEINREDIAFVLWTLKSPPALFEEDEVMFYDPYDKDLLALSRQVYEMMDAVFEEAPISEEPSLIFWVVGDALDYITPVMPEITPETVLKEDVKRTLEYTGGKPLLYFATYKELCNFFVNVLKWENKPSCLLPELEYDEEFVVYANAKGLMIAANVAAFFYDEENPMYDIECAKEEGYDIFCCPGACPFDLLMYGMEKGMFPDIQLPVPNGRELLMRHWDFIARYYLNEYYEGD